MALTPSNNPSDAEKRAARDSAQQEALLREVDEAVRQDQLTTFMARYGIPLGAAIVLGLLAFGGWLWWHHRHEAALEQTSEELVKAADQLEAGHVATADKALAELGSSPSDGASAVARLVQAGIAFQQGKRDGAVRLYAEVAADEAAPQPYRDLATLREISINYEKMKPDDVVKRLQPLAVPGSPFFGSAGELLGAAYLDQNKPNLAGPLFAAIAKDKTVPQSLRSRARQLSGLLGVDAIEDVDKTLEELSTQEAQGAN